MAVNFFLANKDKEKSNIDVIVRFKGVRYKRSTGESIEVVYWNNGFCREVREYPHGKAVNRALKRVEKACDDACDAFVERNMTLDSREFWKQVDLKLNGTTKEHTFLEYFSEYIESVRYKFMDRTIASYKTSIGVLSRFQNDSKTIMFEGIDSSFYYNLEKWMYKNGYSSNYFGSVIKHVKKIYAEARKNGLHNLNNTDDGYFKTIQEATDAIYLNDAELLRIYSLVIDEEVICSTFPSTDKRPQNINNKIKSYNLVRNKFLIGCCTALRVSDFKRLEAVNVSDKFVRIRPQKVGESAVVVPIHWMMKEILENNFDLSANVSDQKMNEHIKEICQIAKIDEDIEIIKNEGGRKIPHTFKKYELVTNHTARRSGATNMYKAGIPTIAIMKITGHTTEKSFLKYIKITAEENAEMLANHPYFTKKE